MEVMVLILVASQKRYKIFLLETKVVSLLLTFTLPSSSFLTVVVVVYFGDVYGTSDEQE